MALLLFCGVLLGVGIHHLIATGTCSSTGYSANYGPVPTCPSGTGWWFAFVFGGIIGCLAGAAMAGGVGLVFAGIFGGIGFGALSLLLDTHAKSGSQIFGAAFGGCFALVGVIAGLVTIRSAISSLGRPSAKSTPRHSPTAATTATAASAFGTPEAASAFGHPSQDSDPILAAYQAAQRSHATAGSAAASASADTAPAPSQLSASSLVAGLEAVQRASGRDSIDELAKLAELHRTGALTDEEFANAKSKLLNQM